MNVKNTTRYRFESRLGRPVLRYLETRGYSRLRLEVPFYERSIDIYASADTHGTTVAVELKLLKWKRGVAQALLYQLCADYSFLAVPVSTAARVDLLLLREHGIGLLAIGENGICEERLAPVSSDVLRSDYKDACLQAGGQRAR